MDFFMRKFPVGGKHIVAHGSPRTASTLLFNMVGVSKFLYLMRNDPQNMSYIEPKYIKEATHMEQYLLQPSNGTKFYKTHIDLENFVKFDVVVFTTAKDKKDAATIKASLEEQGHDVAYVQDMESLKEGGIPRIAHDFAFGYGLSTQDENDMVEYFSKWEILRQCCGQQMSQYWRNDLFPEIYRKVALLPKHHPFCADYDIDEMEKSFMETKLYSWIDAYPNMRPFTKPSLRDGELNGTYCSSYNELVKTQALSFFGQPQINENITIGNWTEEEHSTFLEGIQKHGSSQPFKISKMLKTRTPMQVHLHLQEYILQASSKTPQNETDWAEEEHSIFLEALRKHGSDHPRKIAANLRTRTGIARTGMEVQEHLQDYIRETLSKTPQSGDNEEKEVMKRPALEDKDNGIGGIVLAYDETGKLILLDKSSMSEIKETGKLILLDKKSSTSEIKV